MARISVFAAAAVGVAGVLWNWTGPADAARARQWTTLAPRVPPAVAPGAFANGDQLPGEVLLRSLAFTGGAVQLDVNRALPPPLNLGWREGGLTACARVRASGRAARGCIPLDGAVAGAVGHELAAVLSGLGLGGGEAVELSVALAEPGTVDEGAFAVEAPLLASGMRAADWIERIGAHTPLEARAAADLGAARADHGGRRDAAYVFQSDEAGLANDAVNGTRDHRVVGMAVVIAVTNARGDRGAEALDEMEAARDQVRAALVGWTPPGAFSPAEFRRGRMLRLERDTRWWQDEYECAVIRAGARHG